MNAFLVALAMLLHWGVDTTDPDVQATIGYVFYSVHGVLVVTMLYTFTRILVAKDNRVVQVVEGSGTASKTTQTSVVEYDLSKWRELFFTKFLLPTVVGLFMCWRFELSFPMLVQCLSNPLAAWCSPVVRIYLRGHADTGSLARPWKEDMVVPEWLQRVWQEAEVDSEGLVSGQSGARGKTKVSHHN
ncbi:hypothetical protein TRVL_05788 [Trypanosoma vivax]|nr:hypothetical protein TRVL_05788 [Trypanosoma vivax]